MSTEPEFISQIDEPMTNNQKREWWGRQCDAAAKQGATFFRYSFHPDNHDLLLFEGWKVRPDDQGELRFQTTAVGETAT